MSESFLGEIKPVGFNFAPVGWALCNGQIMSISQNTALFSLLGTTFGGNGQTTFALPDLRGRVAIGSGAGPGLSFRDLGETAGAESVGLSINEMPSHRHNVNTLMVDASTRSALGAVPAKSARPIYGTGSTASMASDSIQPTGDSNPHDNVQPSLVVNYIIALQGIFPPRQ